MLTFTAGPSFINTTGGTAPIHGAIGSFGVSIFADAGFAFRMHGGIDGKGKGLFDFDFLGGYGFWINWLNLSAVAGIGGDFT